VGAVIAARSCLPLAVAALECAFMGRQLPSARCAFAYQLLIKLNPPLSPQP
jgi:hypothetical protein